MSRMSILERVINSTPMVRGQLARYILSLTIPGPDETRFHQLSEKAQLGVLTTDEEAELREFLDVNDFLTIIQSKARSLLAASTPPPDR